MNDSNTREREVTRTIDRGKLSLTPRSKHQTSSMRKMVNFGLTVVLR